ncbi:sensor histidine kinase [Bacillus testis]|uniref:sensor histidine kinase n=1 Tax=Bacillus testis TaxID=1622072 RepID=UPI00067EFF3A|nr:HAMP domain-containing sensor histidine kinase [Bacillus testis]
MKTLYHRIVLTTIVVMLLSSTIAFVISNAYYQYNLKPNNDQKLTHMANDIVSFYKDNPSVDVDDYLDSIGKLGYQIYVADSKDNGTFYGGEFRLKNLDSSIVQQVAAGKPYHGIAAFPSSAFITGFFDNTLSNTVGVPITLKGENYALFIRSDTEVQFGELRVFFALLLVLTAGLSVLAFVINTRFLVKPITKLTDAAKRVSKGQYDIKLQVKRNDEIGTLANQFSEMARELNQVESMRQEFVSNVSHEIQTPLASIKGYAQMLRSGHLTEEDLFRYSSIIENESNRLSQLSKQLLVLASLDKEGRHLEKKEFNVSQQIKQIISMTEWSWREKDMVIELDLPPVYVKGDQQLLHQVWSNLITNSIKYSDEGDRLSISVRKVKKGCQVTISDTGIGISAEDLPHIFTRFYKADKSRNRKEDSNSSGLGLAIVKKIIDLHQGNISVESEPLRGTTFVIVLHD